MFPGPARRDWRARFVVSAPGAGRRKTSKAFVHGMPSSNDTACRWRSSGSSSRWPASTCLRCRMVRVTSSMCSRIMLPRDYGPVLSFHWSHWMPWVRLSRILIRWSVVVRIDGGDYAFVAQSLATLTTSEMGERIGSLLADHGDRFACALDIL